MPIQGLDISLNVRNNTNYPQQINVLGNPANLLDTANATIEYRYNLTSFTFTTENSITIQYKISGEPDFQTYTQLLDGQNLQAVQVAINTLGIGYFNLYEEGGQTYIGSYNNNYEFGDLSIFDSNAAPVSTTTTTTTTTTIAPTTSTTTSTTTLAPTTTSTTSTTTTSAPTTSTTTTTTTAAPTTTTSTTTTSSTLAVYTYALGVDPISGNGACLDFTIAPINYYSSSSSLANGVVLYQDIALSTLVPDNYYADGIQNWLITSGNGTLTSETPCSITTSTTTTTTTAAPTTSTTTSTTTLAPTTTTSTTSTTTTTNISYAIGYNIFNGGSSYTGYNTSVDSCLAGGSGGTVIVYSSGVIGDGEVLYLDASLTIPLTSTGGYYWASGGIGIYYYFTYSGQVVGFTSCPTPTTSTTTSTTTLAPTTTSTTTTTTTAATTSTTTTTTTAPPVYAFCLGYDASSQPSACADYINCGATTVILNWSVGNQSGGGLTILNNVGAQLLNITSTAGSTQSGTIFPLISELPYTIRGEWVSGSGNVIQYKLCDLTAGGTIYTSGAITNLNSPEDYVVTPTPINAQVFLTAQSVPLPPCPI